MDNKASKVLVVEAGEITFCSITGEGVDNADKKHKIYKCAVVVSEDEKERILDAAKEFFKENKSPKYAGKKPANYDNLVYRAKDGRFTIAPHSKVEIKPGETVDITLVDKHRNPLDKEVYGSIGEGSVGSISINMKMYESVGNEGVSIFLRGIQLKHFVPYTGGGNAANDFDVVDDGDDLAGNADDFAEQAPEKKKKKKKKNKEGK